MSRSCARVTEPTLMLFGSAEPLGTPAALSNRFLAGGVRVVNVNDRSV